MRVNFADLFTSLPDGGFSPIRKARVRGVDLKPGVWIGEGVTALGVDLERMRGRDLEIETQEGITLVKAVY